MTKAHRLVAAAVLCLSSVAEAQPPLEAFAALPPMDSPTLSPDGRHLAFISHGPEGGFALVSDLQSMAITAAVDMTATKPRAISWPNDDSLLIFAGQTMFFPGLVGQLESTAPYGVDLSVPDRARIRQLLRQRGQVTRRGGGGAQAIGGPIIIQGAQLIGYQRSTGRVLFPMFESNGRRALYAVDPKNDRRERIDEGPRFTRDWVVDDAGNPLFRVDYTQDTDRFRLLARRDRNWVAIVEETMAIPELDLYGLNDEGELIVGMRTEGAGGRHGLYVMSAETGQIERAFYVHGSADVSAVRIDPYTNRVIGAWAVGTPPVWFDDELEAHQARLDEAFPGESPTIVSWSEDRGRMVVRTERNDGPPAFYLYDATEASASQIGNTHPALADLPLPRREPYRFAARDATEIPGYLTMPLGTDEPTPLVVLPHGGPAARDVDGFDWLAHFLASRGYAVLQPNFRGSGGYGRDWEEAGHGEWGTGLMQHDVTDGVRALIAEGVADPERVCIVGASYGGYAALAGAAFTPELYRCAVAIAGVADLEDMLDFSRLRAGGSSPVVAYWRRAMGVTPENSRDNALRAVSPARHAERVTAPVLLIHGADDSVVPITQSRTMERALRSAGKSVELVVLNGEDHWLSGAETRLETLRALDRFLAQHIGD